MKYLILFSILLLCSSCGPKYQSVQGVISYVDFPNSANVNTVNIGDSLLSKAKVEKREGLQLKNFVSGSFGLYKVNFHRGDYYLRSVTLDSKQYAPINANKCTWDNGEVNRDCFININNRTGRISGVTLGGVAISLKPVPSVIKKEMTLVNTTNFKQEMIYNGKSGSIARFLYREYSGNMARPAFSQELTYDLSSSKIIGFKEVRLEVINTTNTSIKYKVISGFRAPD